MLNIASKSCHTCVSNVIGSDIQNLKPKSVLETFCKNFYAIITNLVIAQYQLFQFSGMLQAFSKHSALIVTYFAAGEVKVSKKWIVLEYLKN